MRRNRKWQWIKQISEDIKERMEVKKRGMKQTNKTGEEEEVMNVEIRRK